MVNLLKFQYLPHPRSKNYETISMELYSLRAFQEYL